MIALALLVTLTTPFTAPSSSPALEAVARRAHHEATLTQDLVTWTSRLSVDPQAGDARLPLRMPLPAAVTLTGADVERDGSGRIVALLVPAGADVLALRTMHARGAPWWPPLVSALERVVVSAEGGRVRPEAALGLEQHFGHFSRPDVSHADRRELRRWFGDVEGTPMYLGPSTPAALANGMRIDTTTKDDQGPVIMAALALAAVIAAALAIAARSLRNAAALEKADKLLDAEIGALGKR